MCKMGEFFSFPPLLRAAEPCCQCWNCCAGTMRGWVWSWRKIKVQENLHEDENWLQKLLKWDVRWMLHLVGHREPLRWGRATWQMTKKHPNNLYFVAPQCQLLLFMGNWCRGQLHNPALAWAHQTDGAGADTNAGVQRRCSRWPWHLYSWQDMGKLPRPWFSVLI